MMSFYTDDKMAEVKKSKRFVIQQVLTKKNNTSAKKINNESSFSEERLCAVIKEKGLAEPYWYYALLEEFKINKGSARHFIKTCFAGSDLTSFIKACLEVEGLPKYCPSLFFLSTTNKFQIENLDNLSDSDLLFYFINLLALMNLNKSIDDQDVLDVIDKILGRDIAPQTVSSLALLKKIQDVQANSNENILSSAELQEFVDDLLEYGDDLKNVKKMKNIIATHMSDFEFFKERVESGSRDGMDYALYAIYDSKLSIDERITLVEAAIQLDPDNSEFKTIYESLTSSTPLTGLELSFHQKYKMLEFIDELDDYEMTEEQSDFFSNIVKLYN